MSRLELKGRRLRVSELQVGQPLQFDVVDAGGRLLLRRGARIANVSQLERLLNGGIRPETPLRGVSARADHQPSDPGEPEIPVLRAREVSVFRLLDDCSRRLDVLISGPASEFTADAFASGVTVIAHQIQRCCQLDSDAALAYVLLGSAARYSVRQQVNVAILTALLIARLAPGSIRSQLVLAATLTMNLGMLALQEELYWVSGPLSGAQQAALRQHPDASVQQLRDRGVDDVTWLEIISQHHEALDGSGYPRGILGAAISREAQIVAVADRYSGMVSDRGTRSGMAPDVALAEMQHRHGEALDPELISLLAQLLGLYPPGTVVALANKEVAVVAKRLLDLKHPIVSAFFLDPLWPYDPPRKRFTASMPQFAIAHVLSRNAITIPIDPEQMWPPSRDELDDPASDVEFEN